MPVKPLRMLAAAATALLLSFGQAQAQDMDIMLATTTSTDNSGLLRELLPAFEKHSGYKVRVIAVGTGKALRMGRDGDVDLVLVHAPGAEQKFVDGGFGTDREPVMYNDFVLVGPPGDPAGLGKAESAADALARIAASKAVFVSRGDDSGTHKKELNLWKNAGIEPKGRWYREAGQGMGKVLQMAGELEGYTLADRGTWLAFKSKSPLKIAYEGDKAMFNPYGIIAVNPQRHADANYAGATRLIQWIISPAAQKLIGEFRIGGERLFVPSARPTTAGSQARPRS